MKSFWISGYTVSATILVGFVLRQLFINRTMIKFQRVFEDSIVERLRGE